MVHRLKPLKLDVQITRFQIMLPETWYPLKAQIQIINMFGKTVNVKHTNTHTWSNQAGRVCTIVVGGRRFWRFRLVQAAEYILYAYLYIV